MAKNNLLSEQLAYIGVSCTPTHLHLCSYNAESICMQDGKDIDSLIPYLNKNAINWIQIHGFQNTEVIQHVCQNFNVDFLTIQDILNSNHQTKIEQHDTYNVVILKLLFSNDDGYVPQQIAIVQGGNYLLTFMEKEMASFISIISELEDGLEDLEEQLLSPEQTDMPGIENIQQYRRNFRVIKKCILPLKEEISKLLHTTDNDLLHKASRPFFNDVNDHLQFVLQTLDGCRDMISALVDIYLSNNDRRMNSIMKQLTVVSTIFIPLTFLAGIWGMNFQWMPELGWRYGYVFAWTLMLILVAVIYFYFKRKKWY